ncbi:hypothetical protein GW750_07635 [bacterium]|nr:hypothetical protein [bacterium]
MLIIDRKKSYHFLKKLEKKRNTLGYAAVVSSFLCLILLTKTCDSDHEYERMQEQVAIS